LNLLSFWVKNYQEVLENAPKKMVAARIFKPLAAGSISLLQTQSDDNGVILSTS
jgi:hypothetical protein